MMAPTNRQRPWGIRWLLSVVLHRENREELLLDLDELYQLHRQSHKPWKADALYWWRALESLPSLLWTQTEGTLMMLANYARTALRNLRKQRLYSGITIAGFAVGLACAMLILLYVHHELRYDRFHEKGHDIYRVITDSRADAGQPSVFSSTTSGALAPALKQEFPEVAEACRVWPYGRRGALVSSEDIHIQETRLLFVDSGFLKMFSFPLLEGDGGHVLDGPLQMVLTQSMKEKYFGAEPALNRVLTLNHRDAYRVVGVVADVPRQSHLQFDFLLSCQGVGDYYQIEPEDWATQSCKTYVLFKDGAEAGRFEPLFTALSRSRQGLFDNNRYQLQPLRRIHLYSSHIDSRPGGDIRQVGLLSGIAVLILFIAGFNYVNLATARAPVRALEIGMRKTLGASRKNLVGQFLGESLAQVVLAALVAFVLVSLLLPPFNFMVQRSLALEDLGTWQMGGLLAALVVAVGVAAGAYPALVLSALSPQGAFRQKATERPKRFFSLRNGVVLVQFAIAAVLAICALTIHRQMQYIHQRDLGFDREEVLYLQIEDPDIEANSAPLKEALASLASIEDVSVSNNLPIGQSMTRESENPEWAGPGAPDHLVFHDNFVDAHFCGFYGIQILQGRDFITGNPADRNAILLNETAVRQFDWADPVGREWNGKTVIGVVKDFHFQSLTHAMEPMVLNLVDEGSGKIIALKVRSGVLQSTLREIEAVWKRFVPRYPLDYRFLDERIDAMYREEQRLNTILFYFAALAIAISCFGLLGLSQFKVRQRSKEIGIRRTLGASRVQIFTALSVDFLRWVGLANVVAWPVGYWLMKGWLVNYAYRIDLGWGVFLGSAALAVGIALLVVGIQAFQAARVNLVDRLRCE